MTTGDEDAVDNLFRDVDDQFNDLEREYTQARENMATADNDRRDTPSNPLEASKERYALLSEVASLKADIARQADELDERDRMLSELGDRIAGFEAQIAERDQINNQLHGSQQEVLEARREQNRLSALLDARAAEREELADVVDRLQNERDNVQDLLTTALARFDESEAARVELDDRMRELESDRASTSHEHDARAHELIESRAEMTRLTDKLADLDRNATEYSERAEKAEALAERRANEAAYLNRRIEAMTDKIANAEGLGDEVTQLRKTIAENERQITELERESSSRQAEAAAAKAAVDSVAERASDYDELAAKVASLEAERSAAWSASAGVNADSTAESPTEEALADKARELVDRARELGSRRSVEAEAAAQAAEEAAAAAAAAAPPPVATSDESELLGLDNVDTTVIDDDLANLVPAAEVLPPPPEPELPPIESIPRISLDHLNEPAADVNVERTPTGEIPQIAIPDLPPPPAPEIAAPAAAIPQVAAPVAAASIPEVVAPAAAPVAATSIPEAVAPAAAPVVATAIPEAVAPAAAPVVATPQPDPASTVAVPSLAPMATAGRKRAILPTDLVPNTPQAVAHLLNQPGVTAIVDARSTCGRTGIRPSELFERVARLRDHFDVPVEVVVTPVSTPVGGAPDLPAIGVHFVTGADTVADRVRAICMGFPADQPLVVIAGDDHVRRAAIGEEANVVEPAAVLDVAAG